MVTSQSLLQIENWATEKRVQGFDISYGEPVTEGYPLQARIILPNVNVTKDEWNWKADTLEAVADIWSLHKVSIAASGNPKLSGKGASMISAPLQGDVIFLGGKAAYIDLRTTDIKLERVGKPPIVASSLMVNLLEPRSSLPKGGIKPVVDVSLNVTGLASPGGKPLPLGKEIKTLILEGTLFGELKPGKPTEALDAWQRAGGVFEVGNLVFEHGPLSLQAEGDVSLDPGLQPIGAFNARVQGFDETLSALTRQKLIGGSEAMMAKLVLGAFAEKPVKGQRSTIKFAMSIQDQILSAGPVQIMELPKISWD